MNIMSPTADEDNGTTQTDGMCTINTEISYKFIVILVGGDWRDTRKTSKLRR